ncbi:MAG: thiolase family protein [Treponema sp.]|nr:thiolase family protein [Treponema sp.]
MFSKPVILSAVRTAVGTFGGSLKNKSTVDLGIAAVKGAIERAGIAADQIDEVVLGCVGQYSLNAFLARIVALKSGCAESSTAQTVNRLCASGLQAIVTAAMLIESGDADAVVGGGAESMSNFPYYLNSTRWGMRMGIAANSVEDALTTALAEPFTGVNTHIAITAENIAAKYHISRRELDEYALQSQERALAAIGNGFFKEQIIPIEVEEKKQIHLFETDEHPRSTTLEKLSGLKPFARSDGVVTAGNASGINDGAAAMVLASGQKAEELGLKPVARLLDYAVAGVDPSIMGMGPVFSTRKLLEKTGIPLKDIALIELNEAFAAQAIACIRELGLDSEKVNVNGGGIALGHPIGATGAVISVKLIHELIRRKARYGIATLCIGGGQGMSALFEIL